MKYKSVNQIIDEYIEKGGEINNLFITIRQDYKKHKIHFSERKNLHTDILNNPIVEYYEIDKLYFKLKNKHKINTFWKIIIGCYILLFYGIKKYHDFRVGK